MKFNLPTTSRTLPNRRPDGTSSRDSEAGGCVLNLFKNFVFATTAILSLLAFPYPIHAQEVTTTASPPRLELETLPGNTLQETLKITNSSDKTQTYKITTTDFIVNDQEGTPIPVLKEVSGRWSLSSWLTTTPNTVSVEPRQSVLITLQVNVPKDALAGGHYAMVTYEPTIPEELNLTGSAISQKVGTLVYLKVQGDITEAVYLKDFSVAKKWFEYGPIDINISIENLGDIHLKPQGSLTVTNLLDQPVLKQELESVNIFPFASRNHQFQLPNKYYFGRFKANLNAYAGTSAAPIKGTIYFWVVPYKEISVAVLAIIIFITIIALKRKKQKPTPPPQDIPAENPETAPPTA